LPERTFLGELPNNHPTIAVGLDKVPLGLNRRGVIEGDVLASQAVGSGQAPVRSLRRGVPVPVLRLRLVGLRQRGVVEGLHGATDPIGDLVGCRDPP